MKILAFVDPHNDKLAMKEILKKEKKADILICAGDIAWFGKGLSATLKKLAKLDKLVLLVHGNTPHETAKDFKNITKKYKNLRFIHRKSFRMGKRVFIGYGGGGFSQRDKRFEKLIHEFKKTMKKGDEVILVTHAPPYNTKLDDMGEIGHVGSKSIIKAIKSIKPLLLICGHIHETFKAKQVIDKTLAINPGPDGEILKV